MNVFDDAKAEIAEMIELAVWVAVFDAAVMANKVPTDEVWVKRQRRQEQYRRLRTKYLGD